MQTEDGQPSSTQQAISALGFAVSDEHTWYIMFTVSAVSALLYPLLAMRGALDAMNGEP